MPAAHPYTRSCPTASLPCTQEDIREAPLELYHRLKLYDDTGAANPKKPVRAALCVAVLTPCCRVLCTQARLCAARNPAVPG